jgi:hypothetical protein
MCQLIIKRCNGVSDKHIVALEGFRVVSQELRKKFILDEEAATDRIETLVTEMCEWCAVDPKGRVIVKRQDLVSRDRVKLVLSARWLASELDQSISSGVSTLELETSTGLPRDQLRARISEIVRARFATPVSKGVYAASPMHVEAFARELRDRLVSDR